MEHLQTNWPVWLAEPDTRLSPITGWSRRHWTQLADRLLLAVRRHASPRHALIVLPGAEGGYGRRVDGLEGFARTLLLAGFRLAGDPADPLNLAEWYADGIAAGCDPTSPERWIRPDEDPQAKVEAAAIALIMDLTRDQLWERLDALTRQRLVDYLAPVVGDQTYPRSNWLWFRVVVETFLRSVQGPWSAADIAADLALHDSFIRQDGWLSDGAGRSFDHYTGWALHLYPALWQRMRGAYDLADEQRRQRDRELLDRYLLDAAHLVGADGGPLIQGRSLIYRSAAAAPFWAGALSQVPSTPPGLLRRAASGIVSHFAARGAPGPDGLLSLGWHHPWRALAQAYSGPGSPYWAAKGFLGLALPASHPVWTGVEEPLPVEQGDFVRPVNAPGWLAHARAADGIVQVVNHGTDHAAAGELVGDSPLYARLGYSSATAPLLDRAAWTAPLEQAVCLVDGAGRTTHRAGLELALIGSNAEVAWAASASQAHWLTPAAAQQHHGSGLTGQAEVAGRLTVFSLTRAAWEVRGAYLTDLRHPGQGAAGGSAGDNQPPCPPPAVSDHLGSAPPGAGQTGAGLKLRLGGWALAGPGENRATAGSGGTAQAAVCVGELTTAIADLTAPALGLRPEPGVAVRDEASPLANPVSVPYLDYPAVPGVWVWVLVSLVHAAPAGAAAALTINADAITVAWPDGQVTTTPLDSPPDLPALASASANQSGANHKVFTQPENKRGPRYPHEKDNP